MKRRIDRAHGRALEILGHAIEYLSDEFVHNPRPKSWAMSPQLKAINLLMGLNRAVYFECPEVPTWRERVKGWLPWTN